MVTMPNSHTTYAQSKYKFSTLTHENVCKGMLVIKDIYAAVIVLWCIYNVDVYLTLNIILSTF